MDVSDKCIVCDKQTTFKCSNCQLANYCCRDHQKQDWKRHKAECCPIRVKHDERVGRYLVAGRDVKRFDIVFKEQPIVIGPAQETPPICLGCYKQLKEKEVVECHKCGWPFCSVKCTENENHAPECFYTVNRGQKVKINAYGVVHPNYQCITVTRCLYLRDNDKEKWDKLMELESHCEVRKKTQKWDIDRNMVVKFIWNFFKLDKTFTEDEIMRCCGILQVNAHEVPLMEPGYIAVYDKMSLIEHNCRANCCKSFSNDGQLILSAGVGIKAGSRLSVCYTDPLWGTEPRRHHLAETKYFECQCERCSDPTEFETYFSAVKCQKKNCAGFLLPDTFLVPILNKYQSGKLETDEKIKETIMWTCRVCLDKVNNDIIQRLLVDIGKELNIMPKGNIEACERFIDHCSKYLHPSHFYMTDVAMALIQLIGLQREKSTGIMDESDDRLLLKLNLSKKLSDLFKILIPAENRANGCILFELHAAIAETGRRKSLVEGPAVMLEHLMKARKLLLEVVALLKHEPDVLPEGKIRIQAIKNLEQLDKTLKTMSFSQI